MDAGGEEKSAPSNSALQRRDQWRAAAAVLAFALLIRGGILIAMRENLRRDPDGYRRIAETLAATGVYGIRRSDGSVRPTAHRPPLYPWVLSWTARCGAVAPAAVAGLHLAMGVATVGLVLMLARQWRLRRWGLLAATCAAWDPILLNQQTLVMTETLATLLAAAALLTLIQLSRRRTAWSALAAGGVCALAALCRPVFFALLAAAVVALLVGLRRDRRRAILAAAFLAAAVVVLAPWTVRNYRECGRVLVATTHGGYTFLLGNNALFYQHLRQAPRGAVWDAAPLQRWLAASIPAHDGAEEEGASIAQEVASDRRAYELAGRAIAGEPGMFLYAGAVRVGRLWGILPHRTAASESASRRLARHLIACWYAVFFAFVLLGAWDAGRRLWRTAWFWVVLLCLSFTVVHFFYWSDLRMRAPLTPALCLLAALGARRLARRWKPLNR